MINATIIQVFMVLVKENREYYVLATHYTTTDNKYDQIHHGIQIGDAMGVGKPKRGPNI